METGIRKRRQYCTFETCFVWKIIRTQGKKMLQIKNYHFFVILESLKLIGFENIYQEK